MGAPPEEAGRTTNHNSANIRRVEQFLHDERPGRLAALLLGQLDAFNRIVTTFGHDECEAFCANYLAHLRQSLPLRSRILELSERRFAVLLDVDSMAAVMDAAVYLTEVDPPQLTVSGDRFLVDLTLGIAVYPSHADDAPTLLRRAELALKEAQERELAFDIYRPDATQQQAALWKFESELESAVRRNALEVYFQPQVSLAARRVWGVESLVRWRSQSGRFVPAAEFIPLAETTGTIVPITWFVFERIAQHVEEWGGAPRPFAVAVNVSPQVLGHLELLERVRVLKGALDAQGFTLTIEITEDSLVKSDGDALVAIERLRKLGVQLAIDDFGKGYSSLTYLKEIPATEIKIDKRFIGKIASDAKDREIVKTVIALAHAFSMRVVAEGVDSAEALAVIGRLGCEVAQGFFIARPMRGDALPEWLNQYTAAATGRHPLSKAWLADAIVLTA